MSSSRTLKRRKSSQKVADKPPEQHQWLIGGSNALPFLPPEVKLEISKCLSLDDLKAVRLVDQTWRVAATTVMKDLCILNMSEDFLKYFLENGSEVTSLLPFKNLKLENNTKGRRSKQGRLGTYGIDEYQRDVFSVMNTYVEGGGACVEELTLGNFMSKATRKIPFFLRQVFSVCSNVRKITVMNTRILKEGRDLLPLPYLQHCKTVYWNGGFGRCSFSPSTFFLQATPNVEKLVHPRLAYELITLNDRAGNPVYWPSLNTIKTQDIVWWGSGVQDLGDCTYRCFNRLVKNISFTSASKWTQQRFRYLMKAHSGVLESLEIACPKKSRYIPDRRQEHPTPVMTRLQTLILLNFNLSSVLRLGGFIFGDALRPSNSKPPFVLYVHFPALQTFKFTVEEERRDGANKSIKACMAILRYFPLLLEGDAQTCFPKIKTVEFNWPDPEKHFEFWKDWTRRVALKFPNAVRNPHIMKWKSLKLDEGDFHSATDRVMIEWEKYRRSEGVAD